MFNHTPHIEMGTKLINSFKWEIHQFAGEILDYMETLFLPPASVLRLNYISRNINKTVGFGERRSMVKGLFTHYKKNSGSK